MSYDTTAPIPGWPPAQSPPPAPRRWRVRPRWALAVGGVVVVALIAGLLAWQPWNPPPNAPTAIRAVSKTATSADVSWTAPKGGGKPAQYIIFRDGKQAGTVPASQTSWTDTGLAPGSSHKYTMKAAGEGQQSGPSVKAAVTTITPPPVSLAVSKVTYTSEVFTWSPSPQGPVPNRYTVYDGTNQLATVTGTTDSYALTGLTPGSNQVLTVTAQWGSATSAPAAALDAPALDPPLDGSVPVNFTTVSVPSESTGLSDGEHWTDDWQLTASCSASRCTLTDSGDFGPPSAGDRTFTVKLSPSGGRYSGSTTAKLTKCGGTTFVTDTVTLSLAVNSGAVSHGGWTAWRGTMAVSSPYIQVNSSTYCAQGNWQFTLTGTGS
ncbi:MAG: chitinase [Actinomycetia bacterium]|nr:chitinase [Actinomycetes bacterium]